MMDLWVINKRMWQFSHVKSQGLTIVNCFIFPAIRCDNQWLSSRSFIHLYI